MPVPTVNSKQIETLFSNITAIQLFQMTFHATIQEVRVACSHVCMCVCGCVGVGVRVCVPVCVCVCFMGLIP
jgi:hypothetical protein